jgi:hypothetical protein
LGQSAAPLPGANTSKGNTRRMPIRRSHVTQSLRRVDFDLVHRAHRRSHDGEYLH